MNDVFNVDIIKKNGGYLASYPVYLKWDDDTQPPAGNDYIKEAWKCALEDGIVGHDEDQSNYFFNVTNDSMSSRG